MKFFVFNNKTPIISSMIRVITFFLLVSVSNLSLSESNFSTGIGHLIQEDYRVDNKISPFPLGMSTVPVISYRSEKLVINGPRVRYNVMKGLIGVTALLNTYGGRYKAHNLTERETSIHAGGSLRLAFLSLTYTSDISKVSNGNKWSIGLGNRFAFGPISFIPRIGQEFLNASINNYYFGINKNEVDFFDFYQSESARNNFAGMTLSYAYTAGQAIVVNYSFKEFDPVIYNSPTVKLRSFKTFAIIWSIRL
jgi:outer membrane scaffolding protein for murein synthesis (MipA/OmpV family)